MTSSDRRYPERPIVGVGAVILVDAATQVAGLPTSVPEPYGVVLVKRRFEPLAGHWSLPGGMLEIGETLEAGVAREMLEETGLLVEVGAVIEVFDRIMRDDTQLPDDPIPNTDARPEGRAYGIGRARPEGRAYGVGRARPERGAYGVGRARAERGAYGAGRARPARGAYGAGRARSESTAVGPTFRSGAQPVRYHYVLIDYLCWPTGGALRAGSDVSDVSIADPRALAAYDVTPKVETVVSRALVMAL